VVDNHLGQMSRRFFTTAVATGPALMGLAAQAASASASPDFAALAQNEAYWTQVVGQHYTRNPDFIQLEAGNFGAMARPVASAYQSHIERVNQQTSYFSRRQFDPLLVPIRQRVAASLGVEADEIAFTRGCTESMQALISGYSKVSAGDGVLICDLDYDAMQTAMRWLKVRRGAQIIEIAIPEPASVEGIIDTYRKALTANPHVKLMLVTHVSHRTGLVMPVAELAALAKERGVDVLLDSGHAWGQLDFSIRDLGVDFAGFSAHKWIGAPVGVGVLYIKKDRLDTIDDYMDIDPHQGVQIGTKIHTGTANFAAFLALKDALDFHEAIGVKAKEARLRYLRDFWTTQLADLNKISVLTPSDPRLTCGLTSFRFKDETSSAANRARAAKLLADFKIFTVHRNGVASGACVRVTPNVFTPKSDIDQLVGALVRMARDV
jgi:isopenicillin-N epimerase